ncbi:MAG: acyclic terpene utilization AtuA family protein [Actinomycetes bacterium]
MVLRVANCSGFFGDRASALFEVLNDGPVDVVTGDYLAELTMLILFRQKAKDPSRGYATSFLRQLEPVLGTVSDRGTKVVVNAGGLAPAACAAAVRDAAAAVGLDLPVAHVEGDDLLSRVDELRPALDHLDTGEPLGDRGVLTANAYLGAWGIASALRAGAQVVVTGRVTDASLVVGPCAAHYGWAREDWDRLAGATVVGHVLECGAQATGGNYSFWREEVADPVHPGFPVAEVHEDGSAVITKHEGTAGAVTVGTVTAQLLYEIGPPWYLGPDVSTDFSSIRLAQQAPDRVHVTGVTGAPPPGPLKVCLNMLGGFRNRMEFVLTGLDVEAKAELALAGLRDALPVEPALVDTRLVRLDREDAPTNEQAAALLRVTVKDDDPARVGRAFSSAAVELALASYPGFTLTSPPGDAAPYGVYWPALVPQEAVEHVVVHADGRREVVPHTPGVPPAAASRAHHPSDSDGTGGTRRVPLGTLVGARSGDKGGNANVGFWTRTEDAYAWLASFLDEKAFRSLLPEADDLRVDVHLLPNLRAVNVVVHGLLGEGVASSTRFDPQAKGLGEYLRSRLVDVPEQLLG